MGKPALVKRLASAQSFDGLNFRHVEYKILKGFLIVIGDI